MKNRIKAANLAFSLIAVSGIFLWCNAAAASPAVHPAQVITIGRLKFKPMPGWNTRSVTAGFISAVYLSHGKTKPSVEFKIVRLRAPQGVDPVHYLHSVSSTKNLLHELLNKEGAQDVMLTSHASAWKGLSCEDLHQQYVSREGLHLWRNEKTFVIAHSTYQIYVTITSKSSIQAGLLQQTVKNWRILLNSIQKQ